MKKILFTFTLALASAAASAQDLQGTTIYDRIGHGQDSIDVLGSLSLYQEAFKSQSYLEALEPWEFVIEKVSVSMTRVHTDRDRMCETPT